MDPITTAILGVVTTLATETLKDDVKTAYEGLKSVIHRKWGESAPVSRAIAAVEQDPASSAQAAVLDEKVNAIGAGRDPDVAQALAALVRQMKAHAMASQADGHVHVDITGGTQSGIIGAGSVSAGSINFGKT